MSKESDAVFLDAVLESKLIAWEGKWDSCNDTWTEFTFTFEDGGSFTLRSWGMFGYESGIDVTVPLP